ncbi:hypothetical protein M440DRAFT_20411 [Trichoderma longibrachiatum ATCC 18648]|uniref:Uncharacterized protein n=1 Tax=Trichoderma longibrachiatum ATCC 18648 TaxID=983965 RepID=A0A2T4C126_TRILO|nr:hypothetical protein M440DRAFT_20411 [Trichoderma longibrachiatum ATCC 18648]
MNAGNNDILEHKEQTPNCWNMICSWLRGFIVTVSIPMSLTSTFCFYNWVFDHFPFDLRIGPSSSGSLAMATCAWVPGVLESVNMNEATRAVTCTPSQWDSSPSIFRQFSNFSF